VSSKKPGTPTPGGLSRQEANPLGLGEFCEWTQEDYDNTTWETCSDPFCLNEGTPSENGMKFCCFCGKPLKEVEYECQD
jgi:hypothetical protein